MSASVPLTRPRCGSTTSLTTCTRTACNCTCGTPRATMSPASSSSPKGRTAGGSAPVGRAGRGGAGGAPGVPDAIRGAWRRTRQGYCVTLAVAWPEWHRAHVGGRVGFDLLVNEMLPGRVRRAGQLVWSGGNGWVWLRGDRQDPERFGELELVG